MDGSADGAETQFSLQPQLSALDVGFMERIRIINRIMSAQEGTFGDCEPVGEGISEMRIFVGPGYRVYYTRRGEVVYLLLCGGNKSSQKRDIKLAKSILDEIEQGDRK